MRHLARLRVIGPALLTYCACGLAVTFLSSHLPILLLVPTCSFPLLSNCSPYCDPLRPSCSPYCDWPLPEEKRSCQTLHVAIGGLAHKSNLVDWLVLPRKKGKGVWTKTIFIKLFGTMMESFTMGNHGVRRTSDA